MAEKDDLKGLEDLSKEEVFDREDESRRAAIERNDPKTELKKKPKSKGSKLPDHIRKAYITINDKSKGDPINIVFEGDWAPSDINLAGRFLILDFQKFVRNRAMEGK